jgi:hypothetical protein
MSVTSALKQVFGKPYGKVSAPGAAALAKITWTGCGAHADQVLANVPNGKRCTC